MLRKILIEDPTNTYQDIIEVNARSGRYGGDWAIIHDERFNGKLTNQADPVKIQAWITFMENERTQREQAQQARRNALRQIRSATTVADVKDILEKLVEEVLGIQQS